jgi:YgiT-type zinc finger domain-containing protein
MKSNNKGGGRMGFWEDERCEYCQGVIVDRMIDSPRKIGNRYVLIKNIPAGVCKKCGTKYYTANVLKTIEGSIRRRKAEKEIPMAVYSL